MDPASFAFRPIARVHSPFVQAHGTPIQPCAAIRHLGGNQLPDEVSERVVVHDGGGRGTIEVDPEWVDGLDDLAGFERIWLISWCHRAVPAQPRVVPYRDTVERGVFATRAPARPNPIALSCVRLIGVAGRFVHVRELDLLAGTPILDIKPYVPEYDSHPVVRIGWIAGATGGERADGLFQA